MTKSSNGDRLGRIVNWPDLSFHYGLSIFELATLPRNILRVYEEALPRILAEQEIAAAAAAAYPNLKQNDQRSYMKELKRQATDPVREASQKKALSKSPDVMAAQLAAIGIGVTFVDKKGEEVEADA